MSGLYELAEQYRDLQRLADDPDADPQAIADTLEGLAGEIEAKATACTMVLLNLEAVADSIDAAAAAMKVRSQAVRNRANGLRSYVLVHLSALDISKIDTPHFVLSLRKNPARVEVVDFGAVPEQFKRWPEPPPPTVDRKSVLDAVKGGSDVPGVQIVRDTRLEIRK
jgi:hypothetical protein